MQAPRAQPNALGQKISINLAVDPCPLLARWRLRENLGFFIHLLTERIFFHTGVVLTATQQVAFATFQGLSQQSPTMPETLCETLCPSSPSRFAPCDDDAADDDDLLAEIEAEIGDFDLVEDEREEKRLALEMSSACNQESGATRGEPLLTVAASESFNDVRRSLRKDSESTEFTPSRLAAQHSAPAIAPAVPSCISDNTASMGAIQGGSKAESRLEKFDVDLDDLIDACVSPLPTGSSSVGFAKIDPTGDQRSVTEASSANLAFKKLSSAVVNDEHSEGTESFDGAVTQGLEKLARDDESDIGDRFVSNKVNDDDTFAWDERSSVNEFQNFDRRADMMQDFSKANGAQNLGHSAGKKVALAENIRILESRFMSFSLPGGISNADSTLIKKGLRMCFAALMVTLPAIPFADTMKDIRDTSELKFEEANLAASQYNLGDENDFSAESVVPVELANLIWAAVLGLEDGESDHTVSTVSGSAAAISSAILRVVLSMHMGGMSEDSSAEEQMEAVGDFVRDCLISLGVLKLGGASQGESMDLIGGLAFKPEQYVLLGRDVYREYGIHFASAEFGWSKPYSMGWTSDFVRHLFRRVALSQDYSDVSSAPVPDGSNVYGWYAARHLPHHMINACQLGEVESLLTDLAFVTFRTNACGPVLGTTLHIKDCNEMAKDLMSSNGNDKATVQEVLYKSFKFASLRVQRIVRKLGDSCVDEGGDHDDEKVVTNSYRSSDLPLIAAVGESLQLLGVAFGEIQRPNDEIIHLEEALRLKMSAQQGKNYNESIADTIHCIGVHYQSQGELNSAMSSYEKALHLYTYGCVKMSKLKMSRTLHNIGVVYCERGEYGVALNCFEQCLTVHRSRMGNHDMSECDTLCWIGKCNREKGDTGAALKSFEEALEIKEASPEKEDLDVAELLQNIGIVYDDMEKYEKSLGFYKRSLAIRRSKLHYTHPDIIDIMSCMANVYYSSGDIEKGLEFFTLALKMRELDANVFDKGSDAFKAMMQSYEDVIALTKQKFCSKEEFDLRDASEIIYNSLVNQDKKETHENAEKDLALKRDIALLRMKQGSMCDRADEYSKAIESYTMSLQIRKELKDYKALGNILNLMGVVHAKRKRYRRAMKCFRDAVKLRKAVLPGDAIDIAETLHNIGHCAAKQGKLVLAMESYKEAYDIKTNTLGLDNLSSAQTLHCIGMLHEQKEDHEEAKQCYQEALDVRRNQCGNESLEVAYSLHSLGKVFVYQKEFENAKNNITEALDIKRRILPSGHVSIAESLHQMGLIHNENGKKEDALACLEAALSACEEKLGKHPVTAEILQAFAQVYESRGDYVNALANLESALAMKEHLFGKNSLSRADTMYAIGKIREREGDTEGALLLFKEVMAIRKELSGRDSLGVAAVLNDVGVIQLKRRECEIASHCFNDALEMVRDSLEDANEFVGVTLANLGELNLVKKDFAAAVENFVEAIDIFKVTRGPTDSSVSFAYSKLGEALMSLEEYNNAVEAYQQCISIRTLTLGADSIQVASVNSDLGAVYLTLGQLDRAKVCLSESLSVMKEKVRISDDKLADTKYTYGKVLVRLKLRDEALLQFQEALATRTKKFGDDDLLVGHVHGELGDIYETKRNFEEALQHYNECLRIRQNHLGNCELVADMFHRIGSIEQMREDLDSALENFATALDIYRSVLGNESAAVAKTLNNLGLIYDTQRDLRKAMSYHKEAHRLRKLHFGEDSLKVAGSLDNIASVYQKQNKNEKALKCLIEALRVRTSKLGKDHVEVGTNLFGMGIVFSEMGNLDKAMECYQQSLNIRKKKLGSSCIEVAQTLHNMGSIYAQKQDYGEALSRWRSSLGNYREAGLVDDHPMVKTTLANIEIASTYLQKQVYR